MMRHECDRCRREIESENEVWYAVRIEALPHASVLASDDDRRRFFTDAGWAPDSAHRELDLDGSGTTTMKQVRLHTAM